MTLPAPKYAQNCAQLALFTRNFWVEFQEFIYTTKTYSAPTLCAPYTHPVGGKVEGRDIGNGTLHDPYPPCGWLALAPNSDRHLPKELFCP